MSTFGRQAKFAHLLLLLTLVPTRGFSSDIASPEEQGDILRAQGNLAAAIEAYRREPSPTASTFNKTGIAYFKMLGFDAARDYFKKSLALDPKDADALSNLGSVYYTQGDFHHALHYFQEARTCDPHNATIVANVGAALLADGKYKSGVETFREAIAIDASVLHPDPRITINTGATSHSPSLNFYLAEVYAIGGRTNDAISYLKKALQAGFHNRQKLMTDADLATVRSSPAFQQIIAPDR